MPEVDFSNENASAAWFHAQSVEMRCTMTSRAALRVLANVALSNEVHRRKLALSSIWAILTSAGRGFGFPPSVALQIEKDSYGFAAYSVLHAIDAAAFASGSAYTIDHVRCVSSAIKSAAFAARTARSALFSTYSTHSAESALDAAYSDETIRSASFANRSIDDADAALSALVEDGKLTPQKLMQKPVWGDTEIPEAIAQSHADFLDYLGSDPDWAFFRRWYAQMWDGTFTDWDLAIEVATLDPNLWEGEDALSKVAEAIREIEARPAKNDTQIEPEPVPVSNVLPLFHRAPIVQASMASMSEAITLRLDAFSSMARPNERIQFVETLRIMPETAQRIHDILEKGPSAPNADTALAMEVGRLRAEVEQLKADLKAANADLADLRKKPWYKKASVLLLGSVVPAVGVALWTLSEEEFDGQSRWLSLAEELKFLESKVWPEEDDRILEELKFELPEIEDI